VFFCAPKILKGFIMRKSLSIVLATSLISINPMSGAFATPVASPPVAAAGNALSLVIQVKDEHKGQGGKRQGGNRGGHRSSGGKPHTNWSHTNKPHNNKPHFGKSHPNKPFVAKPQVQKNISRNHSKRSYRGHARHQHHHWRWSGGRWVRPSDYWWIAGGAIAAGIAIGYLTYDEAAAWAYDPPGPGYCWYYTDPSREDGFWDVCPVQ
jgi:hypothetical protein